MDTEKLLNNINKANEKFVTDGDAPREAKKVKIQKAEEEEILPQPVDLYQKRHNSRYEDSKKNFPHGATADVEFNINAAINGTTPGNGLKSKYAAALKQVEYLKQIGSNSRSDIAMTQYMHDVFLPTIEALVMFNGADMLLNATKMLKKLDSYAMVKGGRADGYTASYIREMFADEIGSTPSFSDSYIMGTMEQIRYLLASDQIRSAVGIAEKALNYINNGTHIASEDDYDILNKVADQ